MSDTALGTETGLAPGFQVRPEPSGNKLRKGVSVAFAGAVAFGLALSGLYLGNRMHSAVGTNVEATAQPGSVSQATAAPIPPPSATAAQPVQAVQTPAPAADMQSAQPELYLEVAALGPAQDAKYLSRLLARGFDARVESSSAGQSRRILIGPYSTSSDLRRASRKLAAAGILAVEATE